MKRPKSFDHNSLFCAPSWSSPTVRLRLPPTPPLCKDMAESNQDEDLTHLISSIVTFALSEDESPVELAQLRYRIDSLPLLQQHHNQSEVPQQSSSCGESTKDDAFFELVQELRKKMSTRPKVIIPNPFFEDQQVPGKHVSVPLRVSRASQTIAPAIKKLPEELRTFPVPWGKRLRTASTATQTEKPAVVVKTQHIVPVWEPMPQEVFVMDDVGDVPLSDWSIESSFDISRTNVSSSRYADTTFLNISFDDISHSDVTDSRFLVSQRQVTSKSLAFTPDPDVEVVQYSPIKQIRTVATNTVHIGWRRPKKAYCNRILNRAAALGWSRHPETTSVATQTSL